MGVRGGLVGVAATTRAAGQALWDRGPRRAIRYARAVGKLVSGPDLKKYTYGPPPKTKEYK